MSRTHVTYTFACKSHGGTYSCSACADVTRQPVDYSYSIGFQLLKVNLTHSYSGKFLKIFENDENFMVQNFNKAKF